MPRAVMCTETLQRGDKEGRKWLWREGIAVEWTCKQEDELASRCKSVE